MTGAGPVGRRDTAGHRDAGPGDDPQPIPDLPLWELIQTAHVVARRFTAVFAATGLSPAQFGVLQSLLDEPDLSQADLAHNALVRPQSMGRLVGSMVERGLVARTGPGGRGRRSGLVITSAGRDAVHASWPGVLALNDTASTGLTTSAAATLTHVLRELRNTLDREPPGTPPR